MSYRTVRCIFNNRLHFDGAVFFQFCFETFLFSLRHCFFVFFKSFYQIKSIRFHMNTFIFEFYNILINLHSFCFPVPDVIGWFSDIRSFEMCPIFIFSILLFRPTRIIHNIKTNEIFWEEKKDTHSGQRNTETKSKYR